MLRFGRSVLSVFLFSGLVGAQGAGTGIATAPPAAPAPPAPTARPAQAAAPTPSPSPAPAAPTASSTPTSSPASPPPASVPRPSPLAPSSLLEFQILERGPDQPWVLQIDNRGDSPVELVADPRLLWFEVQTSAAKAPVTCRLPKPLWPEFAVDDTRLTIAPGQGYRRSFDPRFYCFAPVAQTLLVPNARVVPHFGWPQRTRTVWKEGKRTEELALPDEPPFVAAAVQVNPETGQVVANEPGMTEQGIKQLRAPSLLLSPAYAAWSEPATSVDEESLVLDVIDGMDAENERAATIAVSLTNRSKRMIPIYLRAELMRYQVTGPEGTFECRSPQITGPSDPSSFSNMQPGKTIRLVERLIEVCPSGAFSRPGLYEVGASYHVPWSGQDVGVDGFAGDLESARSALIRVRHGDRPFFIGRYPGVAEASEGSSGDGTPAPRAFAPGQTNAPAEEATPDDGQHEQPPPAEDAPLPDDAVE
jgi:hypothetical protein